MKRRLEKLVGTVEISRVRQKTASEHDAAVLRTAEGERVILQRIGGNPFEDAQTRGYAGRSVAVEGYRLGDIFRFVNVEVKDNSSNS